MFGKDFLGRIVAVFQISVFLFSPVSFAKDNSSKVPLTVFSNTAPITINTTSGLTAPTVASVYPAPITVTGMTGTITKVEVTLRGISHSFFNDLDFLLVSPSGAKYIFLSDVNAGANDSFYTFSDTGATTLGFSNSSASGTYLPSNINTGTDLFPAPAPAAPYSSPSSTLLRFSTVQLRTERGIFTRLMTL